MPKPLQLAVFALGEPESEPRLMLPEDLEDVRLTAYEQGYRAGWDDALTREEKEIAQRAAQVADRIAALSFGYREAQTQILASLEPLFVALLEVFLPAVARASVLPLVVAELSALARQMAEPTLELRVPVGWQKDYATAITGAGLPPISIVETPELNELQADLHLGTTEVRVDLAAAIARVEAALATFTPLSHEEKCRA